MTIYTLVILANYSKMDVTDDIREHLSAEKDKFKQKILENLTELYFLKNDGHMCDYHIWAAKERFSGLILNTKDEDIISDDKFSQLLNLKFDEPLTITQDTKTGPITVTAPPVPDQQDVKSIIQPAVTTIPTPTPTTTPTTVATNKTTTTTSVDASPIPDQAEAVTVITSKPQTTPTTTISTTDTEPIVTPAAITVTTTTAIITPHTASASTSPTNETSPSPVDDPATSEITRQESLKRKRSASPDANKTKQTLSDSSIKPPVEKKLREESTIRKDESTPDLLSDAAFDKASEVKSTIVTEVITVASPVEPIPISSPTKKESPTRISKVVDTIVTPTAISAENQQKQIVERAKHEAAVTARISELRKQGLWSAKRLPKLQEPPRPKTHWDYLLEEMRWLASDFDQERKWKRKAAKKCALMVYKHLQEKRLKKEREEQAKLQQLKKMAATQAKEVRSFWSSMEKIVDFRQQTKLEETRKKAWGLHLNYILDQTSKFSNTCLEETKNPTKETEIDYLMSQEGKNPEKEPVINVSNFLILDTSWHCRYQCRYSCFLVKDLN